MKGNGKFKLSFSYTDADLQKWSNVVSHAFVCTKLIEEIAQQLENELFENIAVY